MKWYAYPLALVAWLLVAIFLFIVTWNWLGELPNPEWYLYLPIGAVILVGVSVGLSYLKFAWELEVLIQVVFVLAPLLWYLNLREPYRPPVYVFLIEAGYTGHARISFTNDEATKTQVRSTADSLFFRFNAEGQMVLNEEYGMVQDGMQNRWYYLYPDGSRKKIEVVDVTKFHSTDSTRFVAVQDSIASNKGKIEFIQWTLQRADKY